MEQVLDAKGIAAQYLATHGHRFALLRAQRYDGWGDEQWATFLQLCEHHDFNPWLDQAWGRIIPDETTGLPKVVLQLYIAGYRVKAHRTNRYAGMDCPVHTYDAENRLATSSVTVYRLCGNDRHPFTATARYEEYAPSSLPRYRDTMPHHWLTKCAEAAALRIAFPEELTGVYIPEELQRVSLSAAQTVPSDEVAQPQWIDDVPEYQAE